VTKTNDRWVGGLEWSGAQHISLVGSDLIHNHHHNPRNNDNYNILSELKLNALIAVVVMVFSEIVVVWVFVSCGQLGSVRPRPA
jgi:hypothetical protein